MSKYTPEPWFVHDFSSLFGPEHQNITVSCDHPASLTVCYMGPGLTNSIEEARANAQLISRAGALARVLQHLYDLQNGPPLVEYSVEWEQVMAEAKSLLDEVNKDP